MNLPKLHILIKEKILSIPRNLALRTFHKLLIVLSRKLNLLYLFYSMAQRCPLLHLIKRNCLLKTFVRTLILMTQVSLYLVSLLELIWDRIISVTPKMVKKVIMNLDLSKAYGPDCIPMVVIRNCVPEVSYILTEFFNKFLKESCCVCALADNTLQLPFFFFFFFSFSTGFLTDCLKLFSKCFIINYQESVWSRSDSFLAHNKRSFH